MLNAFFRALARLNDAYEDHDEDQDIKDVYDTIEAIHDDMSSSIQSPQTWDEWWYNDSAKSVDAINDLLVTYSGDQNLIYAKDGNNQIEEEKGIKWCADELEKLI